MHETARPNLTKRRNFRCNSGLTLSLLAAVVGSSGWSAGLNIIYQIFGHLARPFRPSEGSTSMIYGILAYRSLRPKLDHGMGNSIRPCVIPAGWLTPVGSNMGQENLINNVWGNRALGRIAKKIREIKLGVKIFINVFANGRKLTRMDLISTRLNSIMCDRINHNDSDNTSDGGVCVGITAENRSYLAFHPRDRPNIDKLICDQE